MFDKVIVRARSMVQSTIDSSVNRALVMLSFFIAICLVAAAIAYRLALIYGVETALISLAAVFALVGIAVSVFTSNEVTAAAEEAVETQPSSAADADTDTLLGMSGLSATDRELVLAFASAAAPLVAPRVVGMMFRNIPALLVLAVVIVLVARQTGSISNSSENVSMSVGGGDV